MPFGRVKGAGRPIYIIVDTLRTARHPHSCDFRLPACRAFSCLIVNAILGKLSMQMPAADLWRQPGRTHRKTPPFQGLFGGASEAATDQVQTAPSAQQIAGIASPSITVWHDDLGDLVAYNFAQTPVLTIGRLNTTTYVKDLFCWSSGDKSKTSAPTIKTCVNHWHENPASSPN